MSGTAKRADGVDPVTLEVIQQSLLAITEQMFAVTRKTAMSSVIYEVLDFGVAITDRQGDLACAGAGIPSFVGMLDPAVKAIIAKYSAERIREGDAFVSNDPYQGGVSHTNDVVVVMPVFFAGQIVAWTANKGHWMDVGGMQLGSTGPEATELFQEGLVLPEVKVIDAGEPVAAILDIIAVNSRLPKQALGDFWSAVSSLRMGNKRITQICQKYGVKTFLLAVEDYLALGEKRVLRALSSIPNGIYTAQDWLDDGRQLKVTISVKDDAFVVDLRDNPQQDIGPMNATYAATLVAAQAMFKSLVEPHGPANAGTFRPLKLLTVSGTLFHARRPAAVGMYYENKIRTSDLIWKALADVVPNGRASGHFCSVCATFIGQLNETGQMRSFIEPEVGGWGALHDKDGENAQFSSSHGNTFTCPVEVNEARNGIFVERLALNTEASGAGKFRGGKGIELEYRILEQSGWLTAAYTRSKVQPWSLAGGQRGTLNRLRIRRVSGELEEVSSANALPLQKGDVVWIATANGAGYGDPKKRPKALICDDLRDGYISEHQARDIYGYSTVAKIFAGNAL